MKATPVVGTVLVAIAAAAVATGQALATGTTHERTPGTLRVVMRDPGCHWFSIGGTFTVKASIAGPVNIANYDEAALRVTGNGVTRRIPVGNQLLLRHGRYVITMVGQAPDDNHLRLTVR